jgi:hypothetical protein
MKKQSNSVLTTIIIGLSISLMLYFGYAIINPIIVFMNTEIETGNNISVIVNFFK